MRKRLLFAMLFAVVALAVAGGVGVAKARFDGPMRDSWWRGAWPEAARGPGWGSQRANQPRRWDTALGRRDEGPPALLVPIQFKEPKNLGVGKLLVASRGLGDPSFAKTVVLLVHYDEKGVLGLILNRRTDVPLSRVLDLKAAKGRSDPVYLGGPVGTSSVFALMQSSAKMAKTENIFGGVYLIADKNVFEQTLAAKPDPGVFHVYVGYAGWTQDQLRGEVQLGAWFVYPADAAAVFSSDPDRLWLRMIDAQWARVAPFADIFPPAEMIELPAWAYGG